MNSTLLRFSIVLLLLIGPACCRQLDTESTYRIDSLDVDEYTVRTNNYCQITLRNDTITLAELDTHQLIGFSIKLNTSLISTKEIGLVPFWGASVLYACEPSVDFTKYENSIDSMSIVTLTSFGNYSAGDTISAFGISRTFGCDTLIQFRNNDLKWFFINDTVNLILSERAPSNSLLKFKLIFYVKNQFFEYITKDWKAK